MEHQNPKSLSKKPVIGITTGDYNGIGPEIIIRALTDSRITRFCTPVVYGSSKVNSKYRKLMNFEDSTFHIVRNTDQLNPKRANIINCWEHEGDIQPGYPTTHSGAMAALCLERAVVDLKEKRIDAVVTAPIDKSNIQSDRFKYPGHTEFLADRFEVKNYLMLMVSPLLRLGLVTGHLPLKEVSQKLSKELIETKIKSLISSLKADFGISKPKIAILGLNPHAGDQGLIGQEEKTILLPLIEELRQKGHLIHGPYPADGFFAMQQYLKFDSVLAMYHDQGLIPFKMLAFEDGVNFTAGLPVIRTSPDHGTAFDIAGKNKANEQSLRQAIYLAVEICQNRSLSAGSKIST